jgi:hypothetical protein
LLYAISSAVFIVLSPCARANVFESTFGAKTAGSRLPPAKAATLFELMAPLLGTPLLHPIR